MSSKTFLTISKQECLIVYQDLLNNSQKKWQAGENLAKTNEFGSAISLAIISTEELVKGIIVFLDGKGFDFRNVKGMDTVFRNHQIRYVIAYAMFLMAIFGEELMKFILKIKDDPDKFILIFDEMKDDEKYFEKHFGYYLLKKIVTIRREFRWFSKADIFRQDGFYCDYQEQLKTPILVDSKNYKQVYKRLERVRTMGLGIIDACNTPDDFSKNYLEEMKLNFLRKGFYESMAKALDIVRQQRKNPFELIDHFLESQKKKVE
jgi:AbiV family abortive infection protein